MTRTERLHARRVKDAGMVLFVVLVIVAFGFIGRAVAAERHQFDIGFHVSTTYNTNVVVRAKLWCSNEERTVYSVVKFSDVTPFTTTVAQTLADADHCTLRVVSWDVPPWHAQYHGQRPVVTSWVRP